jgi:hypothetical protein
VKLFSWSLFGSTLDGRDAYIDENIQILEVTPKNVVESINILVIFPESKVINRVDGFVTIKSMITEVVMDCEEGVMLPVVSYAYDIDVPTKATKPIAVFKYAPEKEKPIMFEDNSKPRKRLCPTYT